VQGHFEDTDRFRINRVISEGGMGVVYEATLLGAENFEKTVAIKMVRPELAEHRSFADLFVGEAKLVADLVHQNIVQIYKLGRRERSLYIAMEYVQGVNLRQLIRRHLELGVSIPVDLGAFILSRVCRGLEYAHAKRGRDGSPLGIVHRDISPKNVMVSSEGEVKITDFGIAKAAGLLELDESSFLLGKAPYMSPEQAEHRVTDGRSDLFSLGILGFELLTGEALFPAGESTHATLQRVTRAEIPSPREIRPEIPEAFERILMRSLERDLVRRYQSAGRMAYDLEYFLYSGGYGPTIVTLERHMRLLFPSLYAAQPPAAGASEAHVTSIAGGREEVATTFNGPSREES
jgi:serine/threonine-protein kinase